ncbi:MAG: pseudouridine-5'-phosphate glycosidase, partial [Pseudomonadota bacterium]
CDEPAQIADIRAATRALGLGTGMLVANPIPTEAALPAAEIGATIDAALKTASEQGITGKDVTPFLLSQLNRHDDGQALAANIALVLNNARLAAQIAVAEAKTGVWA